MSSGSEEVRAYAFASAFQPADNLGLGEQASALDLVGRELAAGGEPVDLLGLAAEDAGEFIDGEKGRQRPLRIQHSERTISGAPDEIGRRTG